MKIYSPDNFFARLLLQDSGHDVQYLPSALVTSEVLKDENSIGLIPVTDIIKNNTLFVSRKFGISLEGVLCNTYIYFNDPEKVNDFTLAGDVSSVEALLTKILFKEIYDTDVNIQLVTGEPEGNNNLIVSGDMNFYNGIYTEGISFAEELVDVTNLPFVNYIFVSQKQETLEQFNSEAESFIKNFDDEVEKKIETIISPNARDFFLTNIPSMVVNFEEQDLEGLEQIIRLPYFYGLIKDMVVVNYV